MILVTGASGFLGRSVVDELRQLDAGTIVGLGGRTSRHPDRPSLDLGDPAQLDRIDPTAVRRLIHCAGSRGKPGGNFFRDNVLATRNLLRHIDCEGLEFAVLVSSVSVYGWPEGCREIFLDESTAPSPPSPYGRSKLVQEFLFEAHFSPERCAIIRPSNLYGPGMADDNLLKIWWKRARSRLPLEVRAPRTFNHNYTHVADAARVVAQACVGTVAGTFNCCSDDTLGIFELAESVNRAAGSGAEILDRATDEAYPALHFPNDRVKREFGPRFRRLASVLHELDET